MTPSWPKCWSWKTWSFYYYVNLNESYLILLYGHPTWLKPFSPPYSPDLSPLCQANGIVKKKNCFTLFKFLNMILFLKTIEKPFFLINIFNKHPISELTVDIFFSLRCWVLRGQKEVKFPFKVSLHKYTAYLAHNQEHHNGIHLFVHTKYILCIYSHIGLYVQLNVLDQNSSFEKHDIYTSRDTRDRYWL